MLLRGLPVRGSSGADGGRIELWCSSSMISHALLVVPARYPKRHGPGATQAGTPVVSRPRSNFQWHTGDSGISQIPGRGRPVTHSFKLARRGPGHRRARAPAVCFFVLCNRHWLNGVSGANLGIACLPSTLTLRDY
jgi:hypothetical protein